MKYPTQALTREEATRLLEACGTTPTGWRNRAALTLMYRGGARVAEALSIRPQDIDIDDRGCAVVRIVAPKGAGRGKRPRVLGLGKESTEVIEKWNQARGKSFVWDIWGDRPLCCSTKGANVHPSYMRKLMPRLGKTAGIPKRCHPHILRHTFAFEMAMEGQPLLVIQKALGHTSLSVTQIYLNHLCPADVIAGMQERD